MNRCSLAATPQGASSNEPLLSLKHATLGSPYGRVATPSASACVGLLVPLQPYRSPREQPQTRSLGARSLLSASMVCSFTKAAPSPRRCVVCPLPPEHTA